jgi:cell division septation protein DedD
LRAGQPFNLAEIGRLLAEAAAAAPSMLAGADYVEAANYAGQVEELSRGVEYLQVLSAGTVDRTRTQAVAAADAARASRSRTGKTWVTGWDNGVETLNETDTNWPSGSTAPGSTASANDSDGSWNRDWNRDGQCFRASASERGSGAASEVACGAGTGTGGQDRVITSPADDGSANTAEFLRQRLRIGKSEANRRLALAADILPTTTLTGDTIPAPREHLAAALTPTPASTGTPNTEGTTGTGTDTDAGPDSEDTVGAGDGVEGTAAACPAVSSRAGTIIALTLNRLQHLTTPEKLALIEENLTTTAATSPTRTSSPASPAAGPTPSTPTAPNPAKKPSATPKAHSSANPATACTTSKSSPPPTNTNTSSPS